MYLGSREGDHEAASSSSVGKALGPDASLTVQHICAAEWEEIWKKGMSNLRGTTEDELIEDAMLQQVEDQIWQADDLVEFSNCFSMQRNRFFN